MMPHHFKYESFLGKKKYSKKSKGNSYTVSLFCFSRLTFQVLICSSYSSVWNKYIFKYDRQMLMFIQSGLDLAPPQSWS